MVLGCRLSDLVGSGGRGACGRGGCTPHESFHESLLIGVRPLRWGRSIPSGSGLTQRRNGR